MAMLGELVRDARLQLGWSQQDLAERCGTKPAYISLIETNSRKWPRELVPELARALGLSQIDMAIAAGLIEPDAHRAAADKSAGTTLERRIASGVSRLDEDAQRHVLALVELLNARTPQ